MGPLITLALFSLPLCSLQASPLLFMTHQGKYEEVAKRLAAESKLDETVLQQMALQMLRQGITTGDTEEALLALFGASVAMNEEVEDLFELAWHTPNPPLQLAALSMISKSHSEMSLHILNQAIGMPHPLIRLEAAFLLAEKKAPQATSKIESLMHKIEPEAHFLFPQLFAMIGDEPSKNILRRLLIHKDEKVRCATLTAIAKSRRDDLSKDIRRALTHPDALSKEVAASAAGQLKDAETLPELQRLARVNSLNVKVAALRSMALLNHKEAEKELQQIALEGDLFAIYALSLFSGSEETLVELQNHPNPNARLNATLALLALKDKRALKGVSEILIRDARDLSFLPVVSAGGTLNAFRIVPSSRQNLEEQEAGHFTSLALREEVLTAILNLDDEAFFYFSTLIFNRQQTDLIPLLIELLESKGGDRAVALLKSEEQRAGAPFTRAWATLALYRMKAEGPYEEKLTRWLLEQQSIDLINFRPFLSWDKREGSPFELTPNDKTALWLASLEALISQNPDKGLRLLLELMAKGPGKNRYLLAGLILRAVQ